MGLAVASAPAHANRQENQAALQKFIEARLAESANQPKLAADIYGDSLLKQPENQVLAEKAYAKAIRIGDFELALVAAEKLAALDLAKPEMALLAIADAYAREDWQAVQSQMEALELGKNFAFMVPLLQTWDARRVNSSVKPYFDAAKKDRTAAYYHDEQLVLILLSLGEIERALEVLAEYVAEDPARSAPLRILSARHFLALKDRDTARVLLQEDGSGPERLLLRQIDNNQDRTSAQRITPDIGIAFFFHRLATDLSNQSAQFLSQVMAQSAFRIAPDHDYSKLLLGRSFAGADEHGLAFAELARISRESPYFLAATSSATASLAADEQYEAALAHLAKAIKSNPDSPELRVLQGQTLQANGDEQQAAQSFEKAIELAERANFPDLLLANYWLALGASQEQAGIWPDALESLKRANELRPNSPTILNYLGYAQLERRENKEQAVESIKQAHNLRSSSPAITDSLGWAYFVTGQPELAVSYLEEALAGQPQDPTINEHLGDAYWAVGRKYEARYAWQSAKLFAEDEDKTRLSEKIELGFRPELVSP